MATAAGTRRALAALATTSLIIGTYWFRYMTAVNTDRMLESRLGYYINSLVNIRLRPHLPGRAPDPRPGGRRRLWPGALAWAQPFRDLRHLRASAQDGAGREPTGLLARHVP